MKVTIITVVLNNARFIAGAIDSVLAQTYHNIEYIIVDGGSTDGTLEIINSYGNRISRLIIGKDNGIYHAMNKGLVAATGEVIGLLNSDDFYTGPKVIENVVNVFKTRLVDTVYGDLVYVNPDNTDKIQRYWKSGKFKPESFRFGWMPPHPTFFVKRSVYEKYGKFDTEFTSAADYELMLRLLYRHGVSAGYLPQVLVRMRTGGQSSLNLANRLHANNEDSKAWEKNGLVRPFYTRYLKPLRKLPQFVRRGKI